MDTPLTAPPVPPECSHLKYLKIHKFAELLQVAVPCTTWLFKTYRKGTHHPWWQRYTSLPSTGSQNEPNGQVCCTTTVEQTGECLRVWSLLTIRGTKKQFWNPFSN